MVKVVHVATISVVANNRLTKGILAMASLSAGPRINARTTRRIHGGIKKLSLIATAEGLRFQGRDVSSEAIVSAVLFEFLDLTEKVHYADKQNEEGLLGLAFHPRFAENGEFFVHYSTKTTPLTMVLERYRVSKDDPDSADPTSGEEILRVEHPAWNHKGGTICYGPDGYLYVAYGDGGTQACAETGKKAAAMAVGWVTR